MREIRKQIPKGGIVIKLFASFFFAGHLPKAPGTWGSGFAAIILFFVWPPQWYYQFLAIFVIYLFGAFVAGKAERYYGHDGRQIVIDEVAGQMVALFMAPLQFVNALVRTSRPRMDASAAIRGPRTLDNFTRTGIRK